MTGTAVSWGLGAALVIVASGALWRLARPAGRHERTHQRTNSALHLLMALGMTVLLVERAGAAVQALGVMFGAVALTMVVRGRIHHAVMSGIMVLMIRMRPDPGPSGPSGPMSMQMAMPSTWNGVSLLLLAAFGYAAVSACAITWRMSAFDAHSQGGERRACAMDPVGRGCEITMLVSTAVMLLPMI
ncbi:MAG TPA: DUF5134 domain-containing protein [Actinocrinis sp.]|nr:DUF5134 domain-containing protein [Actinocrinis sp.]